MDKLALVFVGFVAIQHVAFGVLEMFYWHQPLGQKIFRLKPDFARESRALAANQGLYNFFLAAGLFASFFVAEPSAFLFRVFFLACVFVAGVFGALTVSSRIFFLQALPALVGLIALFL